jgi:Tol biopolymer transport system component
MWLWAAAGAAVGLMAAAAGWALWPKAITPARAMRFQIALPEGVDFSGHSELSLSPDGHKLAFTTSDTPSGLWIHDLDSLEWRMLAGTEQGDGPFWSPDGRFLGFRVRNQLKKIEVAGGPPQTLCTMPQPVGGGAWNRDGVIVFGGYGSGPMYRVSSSGGAATELTALEGGEYVHGLPTFLPDGEHFLYIRVSRNADRSGVYVGSVDAKPAEQSHQRILATLIAAGYAEGNLFSMREGALMAQPFDTARLQLRGEPVLVAEHVGNLASLGSFSASRAGVLAYRAAPAAGTLQATWFNREGKQTETFGESSPDRGLRLSPDGTRAGGRDAAMGVRGDIWLLDFSRGVRTRLTFRRRYGSFPVWSPDGSRIAFAAGDTSPLDTIYEKAADGTGEEKELLKTTLGIWPTSWSRDGRFLLYHTFNAVTTTGSDLWVLSMGPDKGGAPKPTLLLGTEFDEVDGSFSPDGHWVAYKSNETGRPEIYVRPFVASGPAFGEGKSQVSRDGVREDWIEPHWRNDGREFFFEGPNNAIMAVDVNGSSAAFQVGVPNKLFTAPANEGWDVTGDGKRFLIRVVPRQDTQTPITVVLNWQAAQKK